MLAQEQDFSTAGEREGARGEGARGGGGGSSRAGRALRPFRVCSERPLEAAAKRAAVQRGFTARSRRAECTEIGGDDFR
jgi:hypothetical protein